MRPAHALRALRAVAGRELRSFVRQPGRLLSALVRPLLWLLVFAAGFQNVFGVAIAPPYETYIEYRVYIVPGLLGMVALFNGMQSSLAMVYDREMGVMRLLLTAPLPRWWILACKLAGGATLSLAQMLAFLLAAWLSGITFEPLHVLAALPVFGLAALMLGALGLVLSVYVKQLENFAGSRYFASSSMPKAQAAKRKASICASDSVAPPASLQARIHQRGRGAVSSRRITPISRS